MRFDLDADHELIQGMARDFARLQLAPRAAEHDRAGALAPAVLRQLGELGLWGLGVPEHLGGAGMDALALAVVAEELAAGDAGVALALVGHDALVTWILAAGTDDQRAAWLPTLASGAKRGTWARQPRVRATPAETGWSLSGTLALRSAGEVVMVAAEPHAFLVALDGDGVELRRSETLGMRAAVPMDARLDSVRVPDDARFAGTGTQAALDRSRLGVAAIAVGIGRAALAAAVGYAGERKQFGKPISGFQAVQWMIADASTRLDAARLLVHRAAAALSAGAEASAEAAMAHAFAARAAQEACDHAIQIHGGYGYTRDYPVERHWRDARHCDLTDRADLVQRRLMAQRVVTGLRAE